MMVCMVLSAQKETALVHYAQPFAYLVKLKANKLFTVNVRVRLVATSGTSAAEFKSTIAPEAFSSANSVNEVASNTNSDTGSKN